MNDTNLVQIIESNGLEKTQSQTILDSFTDFFEQAKKWELETKNIVVTDVTQTDLMSKAREARLALKNIRVDAEKVRKDLKERSLREGKAIDGIANVIKALVVPLEEHLEKQEKFIELKIARELDERNEKRVKEFSPYVENMFVYNLRDMDEDSYQKLFKGVKDTYEAQKRAEKEAEDERLKKEEEDKKERARIEEENKKLKEEAKVREEQIAEERRLEQEKRNKEEEERIAKEKEEAKAREKQLAEERKREEEQRKKDEETRITMEQEKIRKQIEQKKEELISKMQDELDFLFEDVSDDGDGNMQLTEEGKKVYEFITNLL